MPGNEWVWLQLPKNREPTPGREGGKGISVLQGCDKKGPGEEEWWDRDRVIAGRSGKEKEV